MQITNSDDPGWSIDSNYINTQTLDISTNLPQSDYSASSNTYSVDGGQSVTLNLVNALSSIPNWNQTGSGDNEDNAGEYFQ